MEIKGPAGTPPVDVEPPVVRPSAASGSTPQATTASSQAPTLRLSPALFQIGQMLEVVVAKIEGNQTLLLQLLNPIVDEKGQRINLQLRASMPYPIKQGQQLSVQVKSLNQGQPVLNIVRTQDAQTSIQMHLQNALATQRPTAPLFANLAELHQPAQHKVLQSLPQDVRERIQTLWRSLPEPVQLQKAHGLKQALLHAGPFLESQLANLALPGTRSFPATDVRTGLLRLANAIRAQLQAQANESAATQGKQSTATTIPTSLTPSLTQTAEANRATTPSSIQTPAEQQQIQLKPPHPYVPQSQSRAQPTVINMGTEQMLDELLLQTEGGLARILSQQLQAHSSDPQRPNWMMELPVRHGNGVDVFDLRIQREPDKEATAGEQAKHQWTVMLAFDLEGMGPVRVQVTLLNDEISTFWWAQDPATVDIFHKHIDILQTRLKTAGLDVNQLDCQCGIPSTEKASPVVPYSNTMLDERV